VRRLSLLFAFAHASELPRRLLVYTSNHATKTHTLVYAARLDDSGAPAAPAPDERFDLDARAALLTPCPAHAAPTAQWHPEDISADDALVLLTRHVGSAERPLYVLALPPLDALAGATPTEPEELQFPGASDEYGTTYGPAAFSRDARTPALAYVLTNAYGDFTSAVAYDVSARAVLQHISTPGLDASLRPLPWNAEGLLVTARFVLFRANADGYSALHVLPLHGALAGRVVEVGLGWEGGVFTYKAHDADEDASEIMLRLVSHASAGRLALLDLAPLLAATASRDVQLDAAGQPRIRLAPRACARATPAAPAVRTLRPALVRFKSFDGLEVPFLYYHPDGDAEEGQRARVPVVVGIHGGPASQATVRYKTCVRARTKRACADRRSARYTDTSSTSSASRLYTRTCAARRDTANGTWPRTTSRSARTRCGARLLCPTLVRRR
jgi:hypothetical protein